MIHLLINSVKKCSGDAKAARDGYNSGSGVDHDVTAPSDGAGLDERVLKVKGKSEPVPVRVMQL
jgi:hypothetical protein